VTDTFWSEREKKENCCVKVTTEKNNVGTLVQLWKFNILQRMKNYLKFYRTWLKFVFSFLFQCSEVMKLNPQQAPLYVSTKFKFFFPFLLFKQNASLHPFWRCCSFFLCSPKTLFVFVELQTLSGNTQVSHRAPLSFQWTILKKF